ncbi:hypothetical protein [Nocardia australiensis]|uniref:hypothetical protein n=1 Tax=Nocardia australiensis TaxID=2887191 RepID=UPI001D14A082|nr:hypothetical protein [Nocardia australiensis]
MPLLTARSRSTRVSYRCPDRSNRPTDPHEVTIVNIALPDIRTDLHFSTTDLAWVFNAHTLAFGGLLLLGGRAGDRIQAGTRP